MTLIPGYYTYGEAAVKLKKSRAQISRYIHAGLLQPVDLGARKLIPAASIQKFSPPPRGNPNFGRQDC